MSLRSGRERALSAKTLICLLQYLEGRRTTVELKNELSVKGQIEHVDGSMNIQMCDVVVTSVVKEEAKYDSFFIPGKQVLYVHVPDDVNITRAIKNQVTSIAAVHSYVPKMGKPKAAVLKSRKLREKIIKEKAERQNAKL